MGQINKVIALARTQEGYTEGVDADGTPNNHTKYSEGVPGLEWAQEMAWCQVFQSWLFHETGLQDLVPMTASCIEAKRFFIENDRYTAWPVLGAQVFMKNEVSEHVGFVYGFDKDYIYTVEGNTSNSVKLKQRPRRDPYVEGYGIPLYTETIVTANPSKKGEEGFLVVESVMA